MIPKPKQKRGKFCTRTQNGYRRGRGNLRRMRRKCAGFPARRELKTRDFNDKTQTKTKPRTKRKRKERATTPAGRCNASGWQTNALRGAIVPYRRDLRTGDAHHPQPKTNENDAFCRVCFVGSAPGGAGIADGNPRKNRAHAAETVTRDGDGDGDDDDRRDRPKPKTKPKPKHKPQTQAHAHRHNRAPRKNRARLFPSGIFLFLLTRATLPLPRRTCGASVPASRTFAKKPAPLPDPRRLFSRVPAPRPLFSLLARSFNEYAALTSRAPSPPGARLPAHTGFCIACPRTCARVQKGLFWVR